MCNLSEIFAFDVYQKFFYSILYKSYFVTPLLVFSLLLLKTILCRMHHNKGICYSSTTILKCAFAVVTRFLSFAYLIRPIRKIKTTPLLFESS